MGHLPDEEEAIGAPEAEGANLVFPCSASQGRWWFVHSLSPGNAALNVALRWEVTGRLSPATVEEAFQTIVDRHEILRTRFFEKDGEAMQEVLPNVRFRLSVIDLSILPEAERIKEAQAQGAREARKFFDVSAPPAMRVSFLRLSAEHGFLLVTVHHLAFDGWSIRVLADEFGAIAAALNAKQPHNLAPLQLQYGDYCLWQKEYFASGVLDAETAYWKEKLRDAPYFEIQPDHPRPERSTHRGEILAAALPELGDKIEDAARQHAVTLFAFGCAVIGATLHRYTGASDVIFGTQIAGRDDPDLEILIGTFIDNLVMRFDASGDPTFEAFLGRVNGDVQDALIHQRMPFNKLVEVLNPPRDPKRTPLFSISFTVLRDVMDNKSYGDFALRGQPSLSAGALYDFVFFLVHWPDGWRLAMEYNPDLFERRTAQQLLDFMVAAFEFAVRSPEARLSLLKPPARDCIDEAARDANLDGLEALLRAHEYVMDAAVVLTPADAGPRLPYAYITPAPHCRQPLEALPARLSAYLDEALPRSSPRPAGVSVMLALPRNPRGDVDYRALPAPAPAPPAAAATPAPLKTNRDVELRLASIWRDLLKAGDIGPASNFFDLGGHSLLAIRMVARAAGEFGVKIDPISVFEAPTLREFAARLPEPSSAKQKRRPLNIQPTGHRTPIIAIDDPVVAAGVLYFPLARELGADRPFVCIPMIEFDTYDPGSPRSLNEIAADHVRLIREAQPHGPYILCGLCIAAAIAYECAQQLTEAGESVPLIILADLWRPGYFASLPWPKKLIYHLNYRFKLFRDRISLFRRGEVSLLEMLSQFRPIRKSGILNLAARNGLIDQFVLIRQDIGDANWLRLRPLLKARNAYKIKPTSSDVVLFDSDEIVTAFADPKMGWSDFVKGRLSMQKIPRRHLEMFQDGGARVMAGFLKPHLEEIDALRD